jgi:tetratricopeptide (TPR) repeat protein
MYIIVVFVLLQTELFKPNKILEFADYLYEEHDYNGALAEYRRFLFLADTLRDDVPEKIVDCLVYLQRFDEAIQESEKITDEMKQCYRKGWIYFLSAQYDSSRTYLNQVGIPYKNDAEKIIGLSYAHEFKFNEAGNYILLPREIPVYKKPSLGALCSLFPGGGHFYCGRIGDGVFSFFVVGLSSLLAYHYHQQDEDIKFGISLGAALLFYAGNIYGGINAVHNYNDYENIKYLRKIEERISTHNNQ